MEYDAIVIGAGAAGLSAARELARQNQHVCILEARDRVGGRVLTLHDPACNVPIELGAEFIHGESPCSLAELQRNCDVADDVPQTRWMLSRRELRPAADLMSRMQRQLQSLRKPHPDLPFAVFLDRHRRTLSPSVRELATMLVEGFDAADPRRVSSTETLQEWAGGASAEAPTFRPRQGYGRLIESIAAELPRERVDTQLGAVVTKIRWRRQRVNVHYHRYGCEMQAQARRAVVALPLGVLQLPSAAIGAVCFTPELPHRSAMMRFTTGSVIKLVLHFKRPFWEELREHRYRDVAFFHSPHASFSTCWTTLPARTRTLTAWTGGPRAEQLHGKSTPELLRIAIHSLETIFGHAPYAAMLEGFHYHDWQSDAFASGAYSYALVGGGAAARRRLSQPIEGTLCLAGEMLDPDESASVGGAMATGVRAVHSLLGAR